MSTSFNASAYVEIVMNELITSGNLKSGNIPTVWRIGPTDFANGTALGQINVGYYKKETGIGSAVTTVYDLVGSLTNTEGTVINFDKVKLIAIRNLSSTAANYIEIGPDATAGFGVVASNLGFWKDASDRNIVCADGSCWMILYNYTGVPAAAGSTDELAVITQSTTGNTWELLVLGIDS